MILYTFLVEVLGTGMATTWRTFGVKDLIAGLAGIRVPRNIITRNNIRYSVDSLVGLLDSKLLGFGHVTKLLENKLLGSHAKIWDFISKLTEIMRFKVLSPLNFLPSLRCENVRFSLNF